MNHILILGGFAAQLGARRLRHKIPHRPEGNSSLSDALSRLNPESLPDSVRLGYSQISIVEAGRTAYVSGQVASDREGNAIPESLSDQTSSVTRNLQAALDAMGAHVSDIIFLRIYVVDLCEEKLGQSFPIILQWLAGTQPGITGIGVTALAGAELKIEVEMAVRLPE